jgi:hypothetical protein
VLCGKRYYLFASCIEKRSGSDEHSAHSLLHKSCKRRLQLRIVISPSDEKVLADTPRRGLDVFECTCGRWKNRINEGA